MVNNYPLIFRLRVVIFYFNNKHIKIKNIIEIFKISNGSLYNWINAYKNHHLIEKQKYKKKSKFIDEIKQYIINYVVKKNNFNAICLIKNVNKRFNITISQSSIYKILKENKITYKKMYNRYIKKKANVYHEAVRRQKEVLKNININDIISVDETHFDSFQNNNYGWGYKGNQLKKNSYITKRQQSCSVICAISNTKMIHKEIIYNGVKSVNFLSFIKNLIEKNKIKQKYILMDNASIHHNKHVTEYIEKSGNKILYNVPYTPELNPIELYFSTVKQKFRKQTKRFGKKDFTESINKSFINYPSNYYQKIYMSAFSF